MFDTNDESMETPRCEMYLFEQKIHMITPDASVEMNDIKNISEKSVRENTELMMLLKISAKRNSLKFKREDNIKSGMYANPYRRNSGCGRSASRVAK